MFRPEMAVTVRNSTRPVLSTTDRVLLAVKAPRSVASSTVTTVVVAAEILPPRLSPARIGSSTSMMAPGRSREASSDAVKLMVCRSFWDE